MTSKNAKGQDAKLTVGNTGAIADIAKISATVDSPMHVRALVAYREIATQTGAPATIAAVQAHPLFADWKEGTNTTHARLLKSYYADAVSAGYAPAKGQRTGAGTGKGKRTGKRTVKRAGSLSRSEEGVLQIISDLQVKLNKSQSEALEWVQSPEASIVLDALLGPDKAQRVKTGLPAILAGARVDAGKDKLADRFATVVAQKATAQHVKVETFTAASVDADGNKVTREYFIAPRVTVTWNADGVPAVVVDRVESQIE
jgi:hypothetical protein